MASNSKPSLKVIRKFLEDVHNGVRYVDRVVVPEAYRSESLGVAHTIPLTDHMGFMKTLNCKEVHLFWPSMTFDVCKYYTSCLQFQLVMHKMMSQGCFCQAYNYSRPDERILASYC